MNLTTHNWSQKRSAYMKKVEKLHVRLLWLSGKLDSKAERRAYTLARNALTRLAKDIDRQNPKLHLFLMNPATMALRNHPRGSWS